MLALNTKNEKSCQIYLRECKSNRLKSLVLEFWCRHPHARLTQEAICYALESNRKDNLEALNQLVLMRILNTIVVNGITFYSLSENDEIRHNVYKAFGMH